MSVKSNISKKFHREIELPENPWNKANPLSLIFFKWMWPIFRLGMKKDLEPDDMYSVPSVYSSKCLADKFSVEWERETRTASAKGWQPKLVRALLRLCKRNLIVYFLVLGFDEFVIRIVQPILLRLLIKSFGAMSNISRRDQIIYGTVVCACNFIHSFIIHHCTFLMIRTGLECRVTLSSVLCQKIMKLSPYTRKSVTTGKVMNLMTNDLGRFDLGLMFVGYIIIAPIQFCMFIYFLWNEIETGTLGGAGIMLLIIPLQVINGHWTAKFRENIAQITDERSRIMNETILAIKVIKMMAWENPFSKLVNNIRRIEVKALGKKMYLKGFFMSMYTVCVPLTPFLSILLYVLYGNRMTAEKAFFIVAIFQIIIENMIYYFSIAVASLGEIWISIQRMEEVLLLEEQKNIAHTNAETKYSMDKNDTETKSSKILLLNACARWAAEDAPIMSNFDVEVEGDKIVMVIGAVGSGKSSFLHALISELPLSSGECHIAGNITYAAQEPWLFTGTIRDNILFGKEFDKQLYIDVVKVSALESDFKQFQNGDMTIVGGMSLSGGQKARVNLARALYRDADIVLLDDPLSAVDSRVARHIFNECVRKHLGGKLRILATHQLQYLPFADYIIVLKNGTIVAQGTPNEVQDLGLDLPSLLNPHENVDEDDDDDDDEKKENETEWLFTETEEDDLDTESMETTKKLEVEEDILTEKAVGYKTYWGYVRSGDSAFGFAVVVILFIVGQILITLTDYWLSLWTNAEETAQKESKQTLHLENPFDIFNTNKYYGEIIYMSTYGVLIVCVMGTALIRAIFCFRYFLQISINLHNRMFNSLIRAPAKFFDENSSGRIMNRFTKDIGSIDELLPGDLYDAVEYLLQAIGVVFVVVLSNYSLAIPSLIIGIIVMSLRFVFLKTSRALKRIESHARSPMLSHLAASIQGMTTIRAMKTQENAINKFNKLQDAHSASWFLFLSAARCFTVWISTSVATFLTSIMITFLVLSDQVAGGLIGFVITSVLTLTANLQWALREAAEADNYMTSVARALEYTVIEPEASWESTPDKKPPPQWPTKGHIQFDNVSLSFGDTDVLKNLSFEIKPQEKIGIVGRTGAGKSTVISALFRITEPRGNIFIDGVKVNDIGLHELRKKISIIPQDPVLFSGTVRYNLDPFDQFDDFDVWRALDQVRLRKAIDALDARVEDGGINFSIGQRQLICLARAILRKNKILVMDEATANIDTKTDAFVQATIRDKFRDCSIITIAHRLQSVMDCDKILVIEKGCLMEYDHPYLLLQHEDGFLSQLVSFVGETANLHLREVARKHFHRRFSI